MTHLFICLLILAFLRLCFLNVFLLLCLLQQFNAVTLHIIYNIMDILLLLIFDRWVPLREISETDDIDIFVSFGFDALRCFLFSGCKVLQKVVSSGINLVSYL